MRSPACTFSNVTSYTGSPLLNGWPMSFNICMHDGLISISLAVTRNARIRPCAFAKVTSLVAKPGMV